ncbi:MAG: tRNA guanosine(34) transglycosylase Tgt [SAR202 cluster bacterium]|nr:tRNA guanosine(34) transglycosylase Tgt [SAR202 cluster bacterium]
MSAFTLCAEDGNARAGNLLTSHGEVPTPAFMPVATQGSVKAVDSKDLQGIGTKIILGNAYHLYLRPGLGVISGMGGLHSFMGWDGPILTDSGGFQGFSLERLRSINEDGIRFKSHIDGSLHELTPESAILHQEGLGADIIMPLDVCVSASGTRDEVETALARTTRWAARCLQAHVCEDQALFGIVQGGLDLTLRKRAVLEITTLGFPGYAIGGLSVGESKAEMYETTGFVAGLLPQEVPRYLMGVGSPEDLVESVSRGIDMFDCVLPTRLARNGQLFIPTGRINLLSGSLKLADRPVQSDCDCYTCESFSSAYLHHLFKAKELLAYRLATIHNLRFVLRLMEEMRAAVAASVFQSYKEDFLGRWKPANEIVRREQKKKWIEAQMNNNRSDNSTN